LSGSLRENVGKKDAKKERRDNRIPAVLYGGKEQVHFSIEERPFKKVFFTPEVSIVKLHIGDREFRAIVQDVQYHPVTDMVLHVDFLQVLPEKPVVIGIPVALQGTPQGVLKGGKLIKKVRKIKVKALVQDLPDEIDINISAMEIGDSIKVGDVKQDKLLFLDAPSSVIVTVRTARAVVEEVAPGAVEGAEAPAEGEKKEEGK